MNILKIARRWVLFSCVCLALTATAQEPGGEAASAAAKPAIVAATVSLNPLFDSSPNALGEFIQSGEEDKKVSDYLAGINKHVGANKDPKGMSFYQYSTMSVTGKRSIAYEKALLDIQAKIASDFSKIISKEVESGFISGDAPTVVAQGSEPAGGDIGETGKKLVQLVSAKLDKELAKEGVASKADPMAAKAIEKALNSEEFRSIIQTTAKAEVGALYTKKVWFDGKKVTVLACYSDATRQLAAAMAGQGEAPKVPPASQSLESYVSAQDNSILFNTFGCQLKPNESGDLCLVSYGFAQGRDKGPIGARVGYDAAGAEADGYIRAFVGACVEDLYVKQDVESSKTFEGATMDLSSKSYSQRKTRAESLSRQIQGIYELKKSAQALKDGSVAFFVVKAWSISSARRAAATKEAFDGVAGSQSGLAGDGSAPAAKLAPADSTQGRKKLKDVGVKAKGEGADSDDF